METVTSETDDVPHGINGILGIVEEKMSELKDAETENFQNKTYREKRIIIKRWREAQCTVTRVQAA